MEISCEYLEYKETGFFSKLITDYIAKEKNVKKFYSLDPDLDGIKKAINNRQQFNTKRDDLVNHLAEQYGDITLHEKVRNNIQSLKSPSTFTVTTAHQPNIFTGHLYFIYKILHTIKLADSLKNSLPEYHFVPVFYMGNEDADLDELGHIFIDGQKYEWNTKQSGAVGKMLVDDELIQLIKKFTGQIQVLPFGPSILSVINQCYKKGITLQEATMLFVNQLFDSYGLIVLIPDSKKLKSAMSDIFEDDIFNNTPSKIVQQTNDALKEHYKSQANPRDINLFYLDNQLRNRIVKNNELYEVEHTTLSFNLTALKQLIAESPDKFSPNVILRGLYQETILPNVAFIGGGGEISYWLQLLSLFNHYNVPYPVLVLRNSFLIIDKKTSGIKNKLQISTNQLFESFDEIIKKMVISNSSNVLTIQTEKENIQNEYKAIKEKVALIDKTLTKHIAALEHKSLEKLTVAEKKMFRAEKKKFKEQQQQLTFIKSILFPDDSLQERVENFIPFYARWGNDLIEKLYECSLVFDQQFCVISEC